MKKFTGKTDYSIGVIVSDRTSTDKELKPCCVVMLGNSATQCVCAVCGYFHLRIPQANQPIRLYEVNE